MYTSKQSLLLHLDNARRPTRSPKKKARTFPVGQVVRTPMNSLTGSVYHMLTQVMMTMMMMIVMMLSLVQMIIMKMMILITMIVMICSDDDDQNHHCND